MKKERINLWKENEYYYPCAYGFMPNMVSYIHEDGEKHPCMVVVPGGGYCVVSNTEGEIVAKKFYDYGYNAFVVTYTTNLLFKEPLKVQPMEDLSRAIRLIRRDADLYGILPSQLTLCGFSAGAHLCGSICVHYEDVQETEESLADVSNRPNSAILSYPLITTGKYAHRDSFNALIGIDPTEEELDYFSLEKQVTPNTPPTFLWQTMTDELVPVENSYLYEAALRKAGVNHAHHVYSAGHHGLSLGDENWAERRYGEPYTLEQTFKVVDLIKENKIDVPEERKQELLMMFGGGEMPKELPCPEVQSWPELAVNWLKTL